MMAMRVADRVGVLVLFSLLLVLSVAQGDGTECNTISLGSVSNCQSPRSCYKSFDDLITDERGVMYGKKKTVAGACYRLEVHGTKHSLTRGIWTVSGMKSFTVIGMNKDNKVSINCSNASGIVFKEIDHVLLDGVQFINCGQQAMGQLGINSHHAAVTVEGNSVNINVTNCDFINSSSVGLRVASGSNSCLFGMGQPLSVVISNSHFKGNCLRCSNVNNMDNSWSSSDDVMGGGALIHMPMPCSDTATKVARRVVYFIDCVFERNRARIGGGSYMNISSETLLLIKNCQFINNTADLIGGGAYINIHRATKRTLLQVNNSQFKGNTAGITGGGVYINSSRPELLNMNVKQVSFADNSAPFARDLAYEGATHPKVQKRAYSSNNSSVEYIKLCVQSKFSNLSCCGVSETCDVELMLGEQMNVSWQNTENFHQINDYAVVSMSPQEQGRKYDVKGVDIIRVNSSSEWEQVTFFISLKWDNKYKEKDPIILNVTSLTSNSWYFQIKVTLINCSFGYLLEDNDTVCQCYDESDDVVCDGNTYTACVRFGHWFGQLYPDDDNPNHYTTAECPFGSCNYAVSSHCPKGTADCYINGKPYPFFCAVDNSDSVCLYNKGGVMCSECKDGYYSSFPDMRCIRKDLCHDWYALLQTFLYILYLLMAVILVLAAVKFDLRIGSGQIYCLVFYFSVFEYFIGGVFPSKILYVINIIISGILQFNPAIFGMLPLCVNSKYLHLSRFDVLVIQLFNPVVLALVIFLIVVVSRNFPKFAIWQNSRLGINALCIMLYLCFISITQTTLMLLHPIKLKSKDGGVYTYLDPMKHYFGTDHWPYGVISLILQLVLVLPFLCLLLFSPFLLRFRRLNLTRFKPILDEFQACYKTEYRYFAGFYLTCRQLIFLMSFLSLGNFGYIYILQILSIFILAIHYCVQPYKSKALNILDGLLILDLVLLSILHGNTAQVVFKNFVILKESLVYALVLLPVVYFVFLCLKPFIQRFKPLLDMYNDKFRRCLPIDKFEDQPSPGMNGAGASHSVVGLTDSNKFSEREPLLFSRSRKST